MFQVHLSKEAKRETTAVLLYLHNLLLWVMVDKAYTTTGVTAVTTHNTQYTSTTHWRQSV